MFAALHGYQFADTDVVNPDDYDSAVRHDGKGRGAGRCVPWLIHDHGFTLAVVFASCEQDALDGAVDADKLDNFLIDPTDPADLSDYFTPDRPDGTTGDGCDYTDPDGRRYWLQNPDQPTYLGNAGEPFDIEVISIAQLPNPPFSFAALFMGAREVGADGFADGGPVNHPMGG